jgi:hypothetical protein
MLVADVKLNAGISRPDHVAFRGKLGIVGESRRGKRNANGHGGE